MKLPSLDFPKNKIIWILTTYYLLFLIFALINERFYAPDFAVYYHAARNFISDQPVYFQQYGTSLVGMFKYSPFVLYFFIPLAILPEMVARTVYFLIMAAALTFTLLFVEKLLKSYLYGINNTESSFRIIGFSFLITAVHFHRELEMGNVNLMLLLLLLFSLLMLLDRKSYQGGLLIGIAVLFKPHFIVFFPWLLLRREGKALGAFLLMLVLGFITPALVAGWEGNLALHGDWLRSMAEHNASGRLVEDPNTLHHWLHLGGLRWLFPQPAAVFAYGIILLVGVLFLILMIRNRKQIKRGQNSAMVFEFILLLALVPNITYTDTQHFLFSLPLIAFILIYWIRFHPPKNVIGILTLAGCFLYGGNWYEVWRHELSVWIEKTGFLGLGNLLIIGAAVYYFIRFTKEQGLEERRI